MRCDVNGCGLTADGLRGVRSARGKPRGQGKGDRQRNRALHSHAPVVERAVSVSYALGQHNPLLSVRDSGTHGVLH